MGLDVLWTKTKIQSLGTGPSLSSIVVAGQNVEAVTSFIYLGSVIDSSCRSGPDILRELALLQRSWVLCCGFGRRGGSQGSRSSESTTRA